MASAVSWRETTAVVVAAFAALAAACAAAAGVWQAFIAKDTEEKQIRAYVSLRDIRLEKRGDETFDVIPEWENNGSSQTVNMRAYFNRLQFNGIIPDKLMYGDIQGIETVPIILGPKSVSGISFDRIARACLEQFNRRDDMAQFFVWGHVKYRDIFSENEHVTRFCWSVNEIIFSGDGKRARLSYALCNEGNCADKECPPPEQRSFTMPLPTCKPAPIPAPLIPPKAK